MPNPVTRRSFLTATGASAAAFAAGRALVAAPAPSGATSRRVPAPPYKLALGQWSFHRALRAGTMDNLDFAGIAGHEYGFAGVDYVNTFFKSRAGDAKYLAEMRRRAGDADVASVLVLVDDEGVLGDASATARSAAVDNHKRWVEAGATLGCSGIRVNAHGTGTPEAQLGQTAEGVRALCEFADGHGLDILIENHGGISSDAGWLARLVTRVDHPRCGALADFGNWDLGNGVRYDRYKGVAELVPLARAISVKAHEFDAQGRETQTDFARMFRIVVDGGYRGPYLELEYEGEGLSEPDGIRATKRLVERTLAAMP